MQPIALDENGTARFRENDVVRWLTEEVIDLNKISIQCQLRDFDKYDVAQFWQMLGYSVSGYGDLSFIPKSIVQKADAKVSDLLDEESKKKGD